MLMAEQEIGDLLADPEVLKKHNIGVYSVSGVTVAMPESFAVSETEIKSSLNSKIVRRTGVIKKILSWMINGGNPIAIKNAAKFYDGLVNKSQQTSPKLLIIGGGTIGVGCDAFYNSENISTIASDIYASSNTNLVCDAHRLPLKDKSVDGIWIQAVLEHVEDPIMVVSELFRVLKPGGILYSEVPFMQGVHEGPYDFQRFSYNAHCRLLADFERIDAGVVFGPGVTLLWSVRAYLASIFGNRYVGYLLTLPFFWLRFTDKLIPAERAFDNCGATYFLGERGEKPATKKFIAQENYIGMQ